MPNVTLEGVGALEFYLEDPGRKVLSKRISIPVAGGEKAEKELTAKLGPARPEPPKKRA